MLVDLKILFKKYYSHILVFLIFAIALYVSNKHFDKVVVENNYHFDTSKIFGTVNIIRTHKLGTIFSLESENNEYYFRDQSVYEKQVPKDKWLYDISERGDSIYKAAYSDTLFLFKKNGEKYFFVFDRSDLYWD